MSKLNVNISLRAKAIKTKYWLPGEDYVEIILNSLDHILIDNDIIILSEKAISTAKGNLVDENLFLPSSLARFIAKFWMPYVWGYILGKICHFKPESLKHFRNYPIREGSVHKQVALTYSTFLQTLKQGSEGGIDISNLPYGYVCLPLKNPKNEANKIFKEIKRKTGKNVTLIIADTDSTFSINSFHFTSRHTSIKGIKSFLGVLSFVLGRAFRLKQRATPLATAGLKISVEEALNFSEFAHHVRGYGAGRTVWNMADKFAVSPTSVTWDMLEEIDHYPIVLIRKHLAKRK